MIGIKKMVKVLVVVACTCFMTACHSESGEPTYIVETQVREDPKETISQYYKVAGYVGNGYIGEDIPKGMYNITAGKGIVCLKLCENGNVVGDWTLSAYEGYERDLCGVVLSDGQILISTGSSYWQMDTELPLDQIPEQREDEKDNDHIVEPEYLELSEGTYVVGEEITSGQYRVHSIEDVNVVQVFSTNPLAGGVDVVLYPRSEREKATGYSGIQLTVGDRITVQGGTVQLFAEDK